MRGRLAVAPDAFVIMEANPEDVTADSVAAWRALGVHGLSLGVQSFDPRLLRFLGRGHGGAEARRAVELALAAGFDWVSLDLIYGAPAASLGPARDRPRRRRGRDRPRSPSPVVLPAHRARRNAVRRGARSRPVA